MFGSCALRLNEKLAVRAETGASFDIEANFSQLTLDVIGLSLFNFDFDALNKESPVIQAVYDSLKETEMRATVYTRTPQTASRVAHVVLVVLFSKNKLVVPEANTYGVMAGLGTYLEAAGSHQAALPASEEGGRGSPGAGAIWQAKAAWIVRHVWLPPACGGRLHVPLGERPHEPSVFAAANGRTGDSRRHDGAHHQVQGDDRRGGQGGGDGGVRRRLPQRVRSQHPALPAGQPRGGHLVRPLHDPPPLRAQLDERLPPLPVSHARLLTGV